MATPAESAMDGLKQESQHKELEVVLSDMETRLRATIIRVLRPALEQISNIDHVLRDLILKVDEQTLVIGKVDGLQDEIREQGEFAKVLEDLILKVGDQVRTDERRTADQLSELKLTQGRIDGTLTEHKNDILRLGREDTRVWDETVRLQTQHEEAVKKIDGDITGCHRRTAIVKDDLEGMIKEINRQREELIDDLYGHGKGLSLLTKRLDDLQDFCHPIPEMRKIIVQNGTDLRKCMEKQEAFAEEYKGNQDIFQEYIVKQEQETTEMKAAFKLQCNTLVAHHAQLMKDIRNDYNMEVEQIRDMRVDISKTLNLSDQTCRQVEERLACEGRRIDNVHRELSQDIEELLQRRKKDRASIEADTQQFRNDLATEKELHHKSRIQIDYMGRLLGLLLEGCRVGCALEIQSFADRCSERWLTSPSDQPPGPAETIKASEIERQRQRKEEVGFKDTQELVTDLRRGLARGGYQPGNVAFSGHNFDRRDLLILYNRLLHKAQQAYANGPEGLMIEAQMQSHSAPMASARKTVSLQRVESAVNKGVTQYASADEVAMQPAANGGISAEAAAGRKGYPWPKEVEQDPPPGLGKSPPGSNSPHMVGGSVRQRPGSQGQPQAMGSRGTASGPLGETEPPPGHEALKLPAISQSRAVEGPPKAAGTPTLNSSSGIGQRRKGSLTAR